MSIKCRYLIENRLSDGRITYTLQDDKNIIDAEASTLVGSAYKDDTRVYSITLHGNFFQKRNYNEYTQCIQTMAKNLEKDGLCKWTYLYTPVYQKNHENKNRQLYLGRSLRRGIWNKEEGVQQQKHILSKVIRTIEEKHASAFHKAKMHLENQSNSVVTHLYELKDRFFSGIRSVRNGLSKPSDIELTDVNNPKKFTGSLTEERNALRYKLQKILSDEQMTYKEKIEKVKEIQEENNALSLAKNKNPDTGRLAQDIRRIIVKAGKIDNLEGTLQSTSLHFK